MTSTFRPTESSAMVSLQELMAIEEQRLHDEESARRRRAEADRRAAAEELARQQAAEAQRLAEQERLAADARQRDLEQQVRLAAMQQAIVEQERTRVERQAQQARESLHLENERELARIAQSGSTRRLRRALVALGVGTAVLTASGLGLYLGKLRPEAEQRAAETARQNERLAAALADAAAAQTAARSEIDRLQRELALATTPAQRAQISDQITTLQRAPIRPATTARPVDRAAVPAAEPACDRGDPMCKKL